MADTAPDDARLSIAAFARGRMAELAGRGLLRRLEVSARGPCQEVVRGGRRLVSFSDNDYLGLSHDPRVKAAAARAIEAFGAGAGSSRLITGHHPAVAALEEHLAAFKGHQAAVVFGSGYLANLGTVPVLCGRGDLLLVDRLAHACLYAGAQLSGARLLRFRHNDLGHLESLLARHRRKHGRATILTDGVFSMDGDLAPLPGLLDLAHTHDAWLHVDDAHGLGVLGRGRGTAEHFGVRPDVAMGTLSKALGSAGGYVAGDQALVDLLKSRARSLVYTTGLPPAAAAAADAALAILAAEPELCALPMARARRFCAALALPAPQSAIVPILVGTPEAALAAQARLEEAGFLVVAIRPPTVPEGTARLRFSFCADHREADVDRLAGAVRAAELG